MSLTLSNTECLAQTYMSASTWSHQNSQALCILETVEDIALSDHSAIYCSVNVRRPTARKRLVTSRNLRAMNSTDFHLTPRASRRQQATSVPIRGFSTFMTPAFVRCWTATLHWPPDASATVPQSPGWQTVSRPLSASWDEQNASGGTHAWPCTERSTPSNEASWRLWWEQRGNFTSVPGLRTVQTPSSSFQCPVGFLARQRPHHSRLIYHVLQSRTDFACFSLKESRTSDKTFWTSNILSLWWS